MSNLLIAFFAAVGCSVWVYNQVQRTSGGASRNSSGIVAGVSGLIVLLVVWFILNSLIGS